MTDPERSSAICDSFLCQRLQGHALRARQPERSRADDQQTVDTRIWHLSAAWLAGREQLAAASECFADPCRSPVCWTTPFRQPSLMIFYSISRR
jgi:hypothetical protein